MIKKKDLKILEDINYDSSDYNYEDDDIQKIEDYEYTVGLIDSLMKDYFVVTGNVGTWRGGREINPGYVSGSVHSIIKRMNDDNISISFDKEDQCIEIIGHHHDGTDRMCIREINWLSKNEIVDLIKEMIDIHNIEMDDLNEICKKWYDKPFNKLNKSELIDLMIEDNELENYN